jgi:hypothetical protein
MGVWAGGPQSETSVGFPHVRDAPAAVILTDDFLYNTEAFAVYDHYLIDVDDEDEDNDEDDQGHVCAIQLLKKKVRSGMPYPFKQVDIDYLAKDFAYVQDAHFAAQEEQATK